MATVIARTFACANDLKQAGFSLEAVAQRSDPQAILMCEPTHFNVVDAKNPFMQGNVGSCDTALARRQWEQLGKTYQGLGRAVHVLPAEAGVEDMVFAANQVLPGQRPDGTRYAVLANMVHPSRRREVPHYADWFKLQGYELCRISDSFDEGPRFEGQGDALWHPGKNLLWGGFGFRTEAAAYQRIAQITGADVLLLKLVNEKAYHLDTCFCPLDQYTALVFPGAFTPEGMALIRAVFRTVIEIPQGDFDNFAGNALPLGKHVVLQQGSSATCQALSAAGYTPVEVDTSEFMKSGGSVFCLKMMVY